MRRARAAALLVVALGAPACEKETHRAARRSFQEILARDLPPAAQAAALEEFVRAYPEPKTNPNLARACGLLADYHARLGQPDIAASWYERALRASPDDPDLLNALGYHYARHRMNLDRAVAVLESAVRLAEERGYPARRQGFIKDSLGWAYRVRGDLPLAVALLEEANRLAPGVAIIQEHLAEAYHAIGERDRALTLYLDLYLKGRGTSAALRETLLALGKEGGPAYARRVDGLVKEGLRGILEADRRETEEAGATQAQITASDGQRLLASLFLPRAGSGRAAAMPGATGAVLLLAPLGAARSACAAPAADLASHGLAVLTLDLRGHGGSVSEALPGPRAFSARLSDNLVGAERDVRAALAYLARVPRVDRRRLGVVGAGLGAYLAARAALFGEGAPRPAALVLLSPWGPPGAYREALSGLDPAAIFLVAGAEEAAPLETVRALAGPEGAGGRRSLIVAVPGAPFELLDGRPEVLDAIAEFLLARLAPGPHPAGAGGRSSAVR